MPGPATAAPSSGCSRASGTVSPRASAKLWSRSSVVRPIPRGGTFRMRYHATESLGWTRARA